jgi:hypothetical protein
MAECFLTVNLLPQQQRFVDGRQAAVQACGVACLLEGEYRKRVITGLLMQQGKAAQGLD